MPHSEKVSFLAGETTRCCIASADAGTLASADTVREVFGE